jgi:D-alanyl-D-alanine dipeptidase
MGPKNTDGYRLLLLYILSIALSACGGGGGGGDSGPGSGGGGGTPGGGTKTYTVGGTVAGLFGTVVLQNNSGNDLTLSADSGFAFTTPLATGSGYSVTVLTQPASQTCAVANGAGTASGADVTGVTVTCSSLFASSLALFAGNLGGPGNTDGVGAVARFDPPTGVAIDSAGNLYVADSHNNTIRKITPAGVVTTFAGMAGVTGSTDATGAAARFYSPQGVATDNAGNVYVADSGNGTIRKITPAGRVTTLAGTAFVTGSTDATGAAASFWHPIGVATDSAGNVYVADSSNSTIRKITPARRVTTLAGTAGVRGSTDGTGAAASFRGPSGVATDSAGNVYVADSGNHAIRRITPAGRVTTLAGSAGVTGSTDATGAAASFSFPYDIAIDSTGNFYVADGANTIRKITPAGVVTTLAGTAGVRGSTDATGAAASFNSPAGVATDSAGNVYVAEISNYTIRKITPAGVVTTLAGATRLAGSTDAMGAAARFGVPRGVATDIAGNVYVADSSNSTIRKIAPAGVVTTLPSAVPILDNPFGVATDITGNVYVADFDNNTICRITPAGAVTTFAGTRRVPGWTDGTGAGARFSFPESVATDGAGNVYVADTFNYAVRKITPEGVVTTFAGSGVYGSTDATGAAARFAAPRGVATDSAGNVYVADDNSIRKITPAGMVTTLAGMAGVRGSSDGTGAAARFDFPRGVATDIAGNVYVADTGNHTIRKITPEGVVSTLVGVAGRTGFTPGALPGVLKNPMAVAVSGTSLYITLYQGVAVVQDLP